MTHSRTLTTLGGLAVAAALALGQTPPAKYYPPRPAAIARTAWQDQTPPAPPVPVRAPEAPSADQPASPQRPARAPLPLTPAAPSDVAPPAPAAVVIAPEAPWPNQDVAPMALPHPMPMPRAFDFDLDINPDIHIDFDDDFAYKIRDQVNENLRATTFGPDFGDNILESVNQSLKAGIGRGLGIGQGMLYAQQAATPAPAPAAGMKAIRLNGSDDRLYSQGQNSIENRRWDDALQYFSQVAARGGNRADGALYWKAYVLNRLGRRDEALASIGELRKTYAQSRWLDDAKALEIEVNQAAGKPVSPDSESDEELKILALNGLVRSDPDRALPLVENLLKGTHPPTLKKKALFVLTQSNSPRAMQTLEQVARGSSGNPDLQLTAIRYYGEAIKKQPNAGQVLFEIYNGSNDLNVKRTVLNSLRDGRDKDHILQIARNEKNLELRLEALRMLNPNTNQAELWQIYQNEPQAEVKQQILDMMSSSANTDKLLEIARTDKDAKLRRSAIRNLGSYRTANTGDALVAVYKGEQDPQVKMVVVETLYSQRNAKNLVDVAKMETDPKMKRDIVRYLSNMKDPVATDYLMEILK